MDVFIEVISIPFASDKYTKVKFYWWVQTKDGKPYKPFYRHNRIKIMQKDLASWKRFTPRFKDDMDYKERAFLGKVGE